MLDGQGQLKGNLLMVVGLIIEKKGKIFLIKSSTSMDGPVKSTETRQG